MHDDDEVRRFEVEMNHAQSMRRVETADETAPNLLDRGNMEIVTIVVVGLPPGMIDFFRRIRRGPEDGVTTARPLDISSPHTT